MNSTYTVSYPPHFHSKKPPARNSEREKLGTKNTPFPSTLIHIPVNFWYTSFSSPLTQLYHISHEPMAEFQHGEWMSAKQQSSPYIPNTTYILPHTISTQHKRIESHTLHQNLSLTNQRKTINFHHCQITFPLYLQHTHLYQNLHLLIWLNFHPIIIFISLLQRKR